MKQMPNRAMDPATVGHVISEQHWKISFDFSESVNNYGLKRETVWQIEICFLIFYETTHTILKIFSQIYGSVVKSCCQKNRVLELLGKLLARLPQRL